MGVFHVFKIVQMVPNRATHHNLADVRVEAEEKLELFPKAFLFSRKTPYTILFKVLLIVTYASTLKINGRFIFQYPIKLLYCLMSLLATFP